MEKIYEIYFTLMKELNLSKEQIDVMPFWLAENLYIEING
jgi:hypothetical protein